MQNDTCNLTLHRSYFHKYHIHTQIDATIEIGLHRITMYSTPPPSSRPTQLGGGDISLEAKANSGF